MPFKHNSHLIDIVVSSLASHHQNPRPDQGGANAVLTLSNFIKKYRQIDLARQNFERAREASARAREDLMMVASISNKSPAQQRYQQNLKENLDRLPKPEALQEILKKLTKPINFMNMGPKALLDACNQARTMSMQASKAPYDNVLNGQCLEVLDICQNNSAIKKHLASQGINPARLKVIKAQLIALDQITFELNIVAQLKELAPENNNFANEFNSLNNKAQKLYAELNVGLYGPMQHITYKPSAKYKSDNLLQSLQNFPVEKTPIFRQLLKILSAGYSEKWFVKQDAQKAQFKANLQGLLSERKVQAGPMLPSFQSALSPNEANRQKKNYSQRIPDLSDLTVAPEPAKRLPSLRDLRSNSISSQHQQDLGSYHYEDLGNTSNPSRTKKPRH